MIHCDLVVHTCFKIPNAIFDKKGGNEKNILKKYETNSFWENDFVKNLLQITKIETKTIIHNIKKYYMVNFIIINK